MMKIYLNRKFYQQQAAQLLKTLDRWLRSHEFDSRWCCMEIIFIFKNNSILSMFSRDLCNVKQFKCYNYNFDHTTYVHLPRIWVTHPHYLLVLLCLSKYCSVLTCNPLSLIGYASFLSRSLVCTSMCLTRNVYCEMYYTLLPYSHIFVWLKLNT